MVTDSIKEKLKSIYKSNIDKVGVGFGFKIKDGQLTNEKSFTLIVKEKKPLSSLSSGEVFPKEMTVDGVTYPTDVVAFDETESYAFYCAGPNPDLSPTCWNWTTTPPPNRNYLRPLRGGISLGPSNIAGSGTLGLIAVDGETGCLVGLTNNHVVINDPFYTGDRQLNAGISNVTYPSGVGSAINAYQPGLSDPFVGVNFDRSFGVVLRYVPVFSNVFPVDGINTVDAAIVSIDEFDAQGNPTISTSGPNASWRQLGLSSITAPQPFATNLEINSLTPSDLIISAGRTSGGKEGVCSLRIHLLSVIYEYNESKSIALYEKYLSEIVAPKIQANTIVTISGHTDIIGEESYNKTLSLARANDVKVILENRINELGIKDVKFLVFGEGEDDKSALFENKYPEERFYNRTVVIDIVK
jgi:hypothetical protein